MSRRQNQTQSPRRSGRSRARAFPPFACMIAILSLFLSLCLFLFVLLILADAGHITRVMRKNKGGEKRNSSFSRATVRVGRYETLTIVRRTITEQREEARGRSQAHKNDGRVVIRDHSFSRYHRRSAVDSRRTRAREQFRSCAQEAR